MTNINLSSTVSTSKTVIKVESEPFRDRIPANWVITQEEDGSISARNSNSQEVFKGTVAEFNSKLRG